MDAPPARGLGPGSSSPRRLGPATASCAAWNGATWTWTPARSGSARCSPSSTRPSFPTPTRARAAGAGSWWSGRSSPPPAAPSSACRRSPSRRSAITAASRPACAWPAGSPRRSRRDGSNPAGHPTQSSSTWCSAAMAANKEPASIIAAQLRHADGGALAQRVYIHQLPQTAPRPAGVIEGVFGSAARDPRVSVGWASGGGKPEGNSTLEPDLYWTAHDRIVAGQGGCGRDRIRTCVGNAGDFTGRTPSSRRSPPVLTWS
jgi:hypothetical protein